MSSSSSGDEEEGLLSLNGDVPRPPRRRRNCCGCRDPLTWRFVLLISAHFMYVSGLLTFGIAGRSITLVSEGVHTISDFLIYSVGIFLYYKAQVRPDTN